MDFPNLPVLNIPGLWSSGPEHWQSLWERASPRVRRIEQREWEKPERREWVATIDTAVTAEPGPLLLTAHSSGCAALVYWTQTAQPAALSKVAGALLVAPSDVDAASYPQGPIGFAPMPLTRLPFPSIVVASTDDVYATLERSEHFARAWGARLVNAGALGHINSDSRLGVWPLGQSLLVELGA